MMAGAFSFENIVAWKKAHLFACLVYRITRDFPEGEKFGLTSQFRRVAVSIGANVAEGYKKLSKADKLRFFEYIRKEFGRVPKLNCSFS